MTLVGYQPLMIVSRNQRSLRDLSLGRTIEEILPELLFLAPTEFSK